MDAAFQTLHNKRDYLNQSIDVIISCLDIYF